MFVTNADPLANSNSSALNDWDFTIFILNKLLQLTVRRTTALDQGQEEANASKDMDPRLTTVPTANFFFSFCFLKAVVILFITLYSLISCHFGSYIKVRVWIFKKNDSILDSPF